LAAGGLEALSYVAGGFAARVGQRFQPVRAKGFSSPHLKFKNDVQMIPFFPQE
jgi:hypothetical protein